MVSLYSSSAARKSNLKDWNAITFKGQPAVIFQKSPNPSKQHLEASPAVTCEIQPFTDTQKAAEDTLRHCSVYSARARSSSRSLTPSTPQ